MAIIFEKLGSIDNVASKGFEGFDSVNLLDGKPSACVYGDDNGNEYCVTGGQYTLNGRKFLGIGIGVRNQKDAPYVIRNLDLERIPIIDITITENQNNKKISGEINNIIVRLSKNAKGNTYEELLADIYGKISEWSQIYNKMIPLYHVKHALVGARFKYIRPEGIPYLKKDSKFYYPEGTFFRCEGIEEIPVENQENADAMRRIKLRVEFNTDVIYADPISFKRDFVMVDGEGNHI